MCNIHVLTFLAVYLCIVNYEQKKTWDVTYRISFVLRYQSLERLEAFLKVRHDQFNGEMKIYLRLCFDIYHTDFLDLLDNFSRGYWTGKREGKTRTFKKCFTWFSLCFGIQATEIIKTHNIAHRIVCKSDECVHKSRASQFVFYFHFLFFQLIYPKNMSHFSHTVYLYILFKAGQIFIFYIFAPSFSLNNGATSNFFRRISNQGSKADEMHMPN